MSLNPLSAGSSIPASVVTPAYKNGNILYSRNIPPPLDNSLSTTDPRQKFNDCRTIGGWMSVIKKIIDATWVKEAPVGTKVRFSHDYGLLPGNPDDIEGVIVVYETLSKMPAKWHDQTGGHREVKPRLRQTYNAALGTTGSGGYIESILQTSPDIMQYWAQSFDVVQMFTIYGDTWDRMYEYKDKFEQLMTIYSGVFIQGGLQQFWFEQETRDAAYDPQKLQEFPSKTVFYRARIEQHHQITTGAIQQVLIDIGVAPDIKTTPSHFIEASVPESSNLKT